MAYDSRTERYTPSWEDKAAKARRRDGQTTRTKRRSTKAAQRRAYREYGEYDA